MHANAQAATPAIDAPDWAVRLVAHAWQGGEIVDDRWEPMTGRFQVRGGAMRQLKREIKKLGLPVPRSIRTADPI
jgi:hypothetical protein